MDTSKLYRTIQTNMKALSKLSEQRRKLEAQFSRSEALDTYLFGNLSDEMKRIVEKITLLENEQHTLSQQLQEQGYAINGWNYTLEPFHAERLHVVSGMYGFIVQYERHL